MAQINEWLTIDKTSGEGDAIITLTASSNKELFERISTLKIKGKQKTKEVDILQKTDINAEYFWIDTGGIGDTVVYFTHQLDVNPPYSEYPDYYWSYDGINWYSVKEQGDNSNGYFINVGRRIYIKVNKQDDGLTHIYGTAIAIPNAYNVKIGGRLESLGTLEDTWYGYFDRLRVVDASELILSKTLVEKCYVGLFAGSQFLEYPPELPATILAPYCYYGMFMGCEKLKYAPKLPSTTLVEGCYAGMFEGCENITYLEIPATNFDVKNCINGIVTTDYGIINTKAKYYDIDENLPLGWAWLCNGQPIQKSENQFYIEFEEEGGSFVDNRKLLIYSFDNENWVSTENNTTVSMGNNKKVFLSSRKGFIPSYITNQGIRVEDKVKIGGDLLSIVKLGENTFNLFFANSNITNASNLILPTTTERKCYSWMFANCRLLEEAPILPATTLADWCYEEMFNGCSNLKYIKMLGVNFGVYPLSNWVVGVANNGTFIKADEAEISIGVDGIPSGWAVYNASDTDIPLSPSELNKKYLWIELEEDGEVTGLTDYNNYSYDGLEWTTCTSPLSVEGNRKVYIKTTTYSSVDQTIGFSVKGKVGGDLSSFDKLDYGFESLFENNTNLTDANELIFPWDTLKNGCFSDMFRGCTSLIAPPKLPATTLANYCYQNMFRGCTSLTTAPELPATVLMENCYYSMFYGCSNLNYIKMLATDISADYCLNWWVNGVSPTGTFIKAANADLPIGNNGIPNGWTVQNA